MMIRKMFLFLLCTLLATTSAFAQSTLITQIQAIVLKPTTMSGQFKQAKYLVGISKPLYSYGKFYIDTNKGILWQTQRPFPNILVLTRDKIIQKQGNNQIMMMSAQQEPVVNVINHILFSLLAGDFTEVQNIFNLTGSAVDQHWNVLLSPRDASLAKIIQSIALKGDATVKEVEVDEVNGDRTVIDFSNTRQGRNAITPAEEALFDQQQST